MLRLTHAFFSLLVLFAIPLMPGCRNASDDEVFMDPEARNVRTINPGDKDSIRKLAAIAMASYRVKVNGTGPANMEFCSGGLDLQMMSDLSFGQASGAVVCMNRPMDMGRMLAGLTGSSAGKPEVEADGTILRVKKMGGISFNPPRPLLVGPIVQDTSAFVGIDQTTNHVATWTDPATGKVVTSNGTTRVRVLGTKENYNSDPLGRKFDQIIRWEIVSTGYDGIPKSDAFIFDRIEMVWNTRPLVIPKIIIEGNISSFTGGGSQSGSNSLFPGIGGDRTNSFGNGQVIGRIGDIFVGKVRLELEATRFEAL